MNINKEITNYENMVRPFGRDYLEVDSRLRGNDKLYRGNDKMYPGNDKMYPGNDKMLDGNDKSYMTLG